MRVRFNLLWILYIVAAIFLVGYFAFPTFSAITSSQGGFTVTPEIVYINWTNNYMPNVSINVTSSFSNMTFQIMNGTFAANYSQSNSNGPTVCNPYNLYIQNASNGNFTTITPIINSSENVTMNFVDISNQVCVPGRYMINSLIINATNFTGGTTNSYADNVSIRVIADIPISSNNFNNPNFASTGVATFSGSLPAYAPTYQSYYFNTSTIPGATAVTVNLTGWSSSQNVNMFLFDDQGIQRAKSINTNTSQIMSYAYLPPTPKMWEIRIYGNSSSSIPYTGYVIFSTLNVTNASFSSQQISAFNYGLINVTSSNVTNITIVNQGNLNIPNVVLSNSIYRINKFTGSGSMNFTFLAGDSSFDSKIRVGLFWPVGVSNYSFYVYNSSGSLIMQSSNFYTIANVSNASAVELFNETTAIVPGYWNVSVINNTGSDTFNLNISIYQNTNWIATNFTNPSSFNGNTSNTTVLVNLTVPSPAIDGTYQGFLTLRDGNSGQINIPISLNVSTPTLLIQGVNSTAVTPNMFNSGTIRIDEDIGSTLNKIVFINISNAGSVNMYLNMTLNSTNLLCSNCSSTYTANLTYNTTTTIPAKSSQLIWINASFNNTAPVGTYTGWIVINGTNNTQTLSSQPYSAYTLTITLNLTNLLNVTPTSILANSSTISNPLAANESDQMSMQISYLNGTALESPYLINASNFTVWLQEGNVSGILGNISNLLVTNSSRAATIFQSPNYVINYSVPAGSLGGQYYVNARLAYNGSGNNTFYGTGSLGLLEINNTGLFMSSNVTFDTTSCNFGVFPCPTSFTSSNSLTLIAGDTKNVFVNVTNYGGLSNNILNEVVNFTESCAAYSVAAATPSGGACTGTPIGAQWTISSMGATTSCLLEWTITASGNGTACTGSLSVSKPSIWFDPNGFNISVAVNSAPSTSTSTQGAAGAAAGTTGTTPAKYLEITTYPSVFLVEQKKSNSTVVIVTNINTSRTQDIALKVLSANITWLTVSPSIQTSIGILKATNFTVSASAPADAEVKDYDSKFVAIGNFANVSVNFKLRVLPSAETKLAINQTFDLLKLNYTKLSDEINKSKASGLNVTNTSAKFAEITLKMKQVQDAISAGDYFTANVAITEIKSLMNDAYTALASEKKSSSVFGFDLTKLLIFGSNTIYIIIAAVAVGGGLFIAYLFWPTKIKPALQDRIPSKISAPKISLPKKESKETYIEIEKIKNVSNSDEDNVWDKLRDKWSEFSKKRYK